MTPTCKDREKTPFVRNKDIIITHGLFIGKIKKLYDNVLAAAVELFLTFLHKLNMLRVQSEGRRDRTNNLNSIKR